MLPAVKNWDWSPPWILLEIEGKSCTKITFCNPAKKGEKHIMLLQLSSWILLENEKSVYSNRDTETAKISQLFTYGCFTEFVLFFTGATMNSHLLSSNWCKDYTTHSQMFQKVESG